MLPTTRTVKPIAVVALLAALPLAACGNPGSEDAEAAEAPNDATSAWPTVPEGTELTFAVDEDVSTRSAHAGDSFLSTLTESARGVDGRAALPAGTLGRWTVVESTDDNGDGEALLAVGLDAVRVEGRWYPVEGTVVSADLDQDAKDSDAETAAKIGIGAAAGALAGRLLGSGGSDALKGAGVGAAFGTAVALSTRGASTTLHRGARLSVRLDRGLVLDRR